MLPPGARALARLCRTMWVEAAAHDELSSCMPGGNRRSKAKRIALPDHGSASLWVGCYRRVTGKKIIRSGLGKVGAWPAGSAGLMASFPARSTAR